MCAILGAYNIDKTKFKEALNLMRHRGDDDSNIVEFNNYLFGFNHLAIENLNNNTQPLCRDGVLIVFNGEIYNYKEFADSEIEAIFYLYKKYGVKFVNKLDGMFAIAIYDKKLYLFRDIFGKKPLYFTKNGIFSSEIKAILKLLNTSNINLKALAEYLNLNSSIAPNTIYEGIYKLPAGCYYDGEIKRYYDFKREVIDISLDEAVDEVDRLLKKSILKRMQSKVEIGSLLSGGIDSSLIASLMPKVVKTFSIGYDGYENYDERKWARVVANNISSNHTEVSMNKKEFFENIDKVIDAMDEPIADSAYIPAFHLATKIPLKVVMSGEGSDELFLGYRRYEEFFELQNSSLPNKMWLKKYLERHYEDIKEWEVFRRFFANEEIFRGINEVFFQRQIDKLLKTKGKTKGKSSGIIDVDYKRFLPFDDSFNFTYFDLKVWLGEVLLMKLDKMFMANSIEARSPFLDKELVEFIFSLPEEIRGRKKSLIKKVASRYIPHEIINRRKKGFAYPFLEWLKEENEFSYILTINQKQNFLMKII